MNYTRGKRGFGGNAPNKLMASAEGKGSELASDPCRRHGQKLVATDTTDTKVQYYYY